MSTELNGMPAEAACDDSPAARGQRRWAMATVALVLLATTGYAVVRYHVLKGVPWHDFPLWTMNKSLSLAAMLLIGLAGIAGIAREQGAVASAVLWRAVLWLVALHVVVSVAILDPARYPGFYAVVTTTTITLHGLCGLSLLLGAVAVVTLVLGRGRGVKPGRSLLLISAAFLHVALLGFAGWFNRFTWPGGLPPVSLLACAGCAVGMLAITWTWVRRARSV